MFKKIAGWLLVALSLLVLVSSMSLFMRGSGDTFPHLPPDQFAALLAGRLATIILPLVVGIFLLKQAKKTEQQPNTIPNTEESLISEGRARYLTVIVIWALAILLFATVIRPVAYEIAYRNGALAGALVFSGYIVLGFFLPWWMIIRRKSANTNSRDVPFVEKRRTPESEATKPKSFVEMHHEQNRQRFLQSQSDSRSEYNRYAADGARRNPNVMSSSGHAASDAWQTAITFLPDTKKIYDQLHNIDPEHAEKFKSDRLRLKDFSNAQHEYWSLINQIAEEACGTTNPNSRAFLLSAINNGDYESARRFIALAKVLGAANMNGDVLAKFKSSTEKNTSIEAATPTKSKRTQRRDLEFDDG